MPWTDLHAEVEGEFRSLQDRLLDDADAVLYQLRERRKSADRQRSAEKYKRLRLDAARYTAHLLRKAQRAALLRVAVLAVEGGRGVSKDAEYQRAYKARRRAAGVCIACGEPATEHTRCPACHAKALASSRRRLAEAKAALAVAQESGFVPVPAAHRPARGSARPTREILAESAAKRRAARARQPASASP